MMRKGKAEAGVPGMGRRAFVDRLLSALKAGAGWAVLSPALGGCETDVMKSLDEGGTLDVSAEPALTQAGGAVKRTIAGLNGGRPLLISRQADDAFLVLSTVCTHEACEVNLPGVRAPEGVIGCDCHGSQFDASSGSVVRGPAPAPLRRFESLYDAESGVLTITTV